MKSVVNIWKKEILSYYNSPIAYVVTAFFLALTALGFLVFGSFLAAGQATMRAYFGLFPLVLAIVIPALTMRTWAEERKTGSLEMLLTLPLRPGELVLGKFLGAYTVVLVMILGTLPMVLMVLPLGDFEMAQILGEYLGTLLMGATGVALGIFASALTRNHVSAFLLGLVLLLFISLASQLGELLPGPGFLKDLLRYISLDYQFATFQRGILDSRNLSYFLLSTLLFLYLNTKLLIFRKWK